LNLISRSKTLRVKSALRFIRCGSVATGFLLARKRKSGPAAYSWPRSGPSCKTKCPKAAPAQRLPTQTPPRSADVGTQSRALWPFRCQEAIETSPAQIFPTPTLLRLPPCSTTRSKSTVRKSFRTQCLCLDSVSCLQNQLRTAASTHRQTLPLHS
jgi:hypothetical protein